MKLTQKQIDMMTASKNVDEWNANCDRVKKDCGGYPADWYEKVVASGLAARTSAKWGGDADIHIA